MAAAARCVRSLLRNSSNLSSSSKLVFRGLNSANSARTVSSISLRTGLKETGLINSSRNCSLVAKANNFTNLRPVSSLCNLSTMSLLNVDSSGTSGEVMEGSGEDDGETWSQNSEEGYIGDDT